ncbi:hypothetical protein JCM11641_004023, partial [Rhodosporidiobolus odoratus]
MACPDCGDSPNIVICDGSVIGFASKYLSGDLRPPTMPTSASSSRRNVKLIASAALASNNLGLSARATTKLRKAGRAWAYGGDPAELVELLWEVDRNGDELGQLLAIGPDHIFHLLPPPFLGQLDDYLSQNIVSLPLLQRIPALFALHPHTLKPPAKSFLSGLSRRAAIVLAALKTKASVEAALPPALAARASDREASHPALQDWRST